MNLNDIALTLDLEPLTPEVRPDPEVQVSGGYVSDLLSDVLANAPAGGVLVTIQVHLNVVAVAVHADLAAVIFAAGRVPEADVRAKAVEAGIALYSSKESAYDIVGRLYELGLRG
jgi:hypothetical protein